ncbi:MAG: ribulose-phosphate 3-epimerase, partial [Lachnospiraceae bacterium]|nr:ribulose-phosphate 3-epimerase [Lachnospiraceae bacterium]
FVPNISFGVPVLKSVRKCTDAVLDVHLMIEEPVCYVKVFYEAGADIITVHAEACGDLPGTLDVLKDLAERGDRPLKYGIVLNPETPVSEAVPYIDNVYMILLMGVHPGFGGQKFIEEVYGKIEELSGIIEERGSSCLIEVDGGTNRENAERLAMAGADIIVAGSAVFSGDPVRNTLELIEKIR